MPNVDLAGAVGFSRPLPRAAWANHPERVLRYVQLLRLAWVVRIAAIGVAALLLHLAHMI